jgi:hypothetical protein
MKIKIKIKIALLALITAIAIPAAAQTNIPTFFQSAENYLTTFNTNYTWTNVDYEVSDGLKQVTGSGSTDVINAQRDIDSFVIGASVGFDGVGSTIGTAQLITGYNIYQHYDTEITLEVESGYSWYQKTEVIEPELAIEKKLTANTFARLGVSLPVYFKRAFNRTPTFEAGIGFTF